MSGPSLVTSIDVLCDVCRERRGERYTSYSDECADPEHTVQECDTDRYYHQSQLFDDTRVGTAIREIMLFVTFGAIVAREAIVFVSIVRRFMT